jgi:predicted DsbA family dithiol-disulfide isomerase
MKIEVWSDYVCPFCYIGKKQLEKAIRDSGYEDQIEVTYKSFLLDPTTPENTTKSVYESLSQKFGSSIEEVKKMTAGVAARAKEVGLNYNFDEMKSANTVKAHRLAKWIESQNNELAKAYTEQVLQAYFIQGKAIGLDEELLAIIEQLGLDVEEAKNVLAQNEFESEMQQDIYEANQIGVRGVPFFVFNNKWGISGAQPQQLFEQTIEQAAEDAGLKKNITIVGDGPVCTDDQCDF